MCSQQSKGAKRPQKSFNRADAFFIKITRFHAVLKPIFRSLKPFQAFSSLLNLRARDFSFYMNTYNGTSTSTDIVAVLEGMDPNVPSTVLRRAVGAGAQQYLDGASLDEAVETARQESALWLAEQN